MVRRALARTAARRLVADIHLWLSLIVGAQVFLWIASGLFMTLPPIEKVRSEHRLADPPPSDLAKSGPFIAPEAVMRDAGAPLKRLSLDLLGGKPVYVGERSSGETLLLDARTGRLLSPIDERLARAIAEQTLKGGLKSARATWIADRPPIEYRGALPVWRIDFGDADRLSLYVSPQSGKILARRSDLWRAYDFFWSLHIMDYRGRENFHHPLLIMFAGSALAMAISGLGLLVLRLPQRLRRRNVRTRRSFRNSRSR